MDTCQSGGIPHSLLGHTALGINPAHQGGPVCQVPSVGYRQHGTIFQSPQARGQLLVRAGGSRSWGKSVLGCLGLVCLDNDHSEVSLSRRPAHLSF